MVPPQVGQRSTMCAEGVSVLDDKGISNADAYGTALVPIAFSIIPP
jgi:hypothetical protein